MSIKADRWIKRMALEHGMIEPFVEGQIREGVVSYGLSSYGYDIRVADEFKVFTNVYGSVIDPKSFDPRSFVDMKADVCIICLLYTSDAADERSSVDLGGRRII